MVDVLRPVRGTPELNEPSLESALMGVPPAIASATREWAHRAGNLEVHAPDARFREFRLAVDVLLPEFAACLDGLRRGPGDAMLCVLDSHLDRGLDDVEARALLNLWIRVDFIHRFPIADGFRILAGGVFREEHVGIAYTLDSAAFGSKERDAVATLEALENAGIVPAILFVKASQAAHLAAQTGPLARCVERLAGLGTSPGVIVPANRLLGADSTPMRASIVRRCWKSSARVVIRYDSPPVRLRDIAAMQAGIYDAAERFDASMSPAQSIDEQDMARWGAYLPAGAYTPQRFDMRTPAAEWKGDDAIVELVPVPYGEGLRATWDSARQSPLRRLERLLDYFRIESYLRRITDIGFAQRYHEFRVYNWGTGDPTPRTLLLDCGPLGAFDDAAGLIRDLKRLRLQLGRRLHADAAGFFGAALAEAKARTVHRSADAIQLQHDQHEYLETIDAAAPLRADVADFAASMPPSLGATLELGAGFGQLASRLRERAASYVAVDLQPNMLAAAARSAGTRGVVGDFHHLPFGDALFDSVIANNVLEHAYDPLAALREIYRTLKRGGALYALIPLDGLNPAYRLPAHLWKTDLPGIRLAAEAAGLDVEAADPINLYAMGIPASFPSCHGLVCRLRARRPWSF